jgi:hypothetical protein
LPISKPIALTLCCLVPLLTSAVLAWRLARGSLWGWFVSMTLAAGAGALAVFLLASRVSRGLSPSMALSLAPHHGVLLALSTALVIVLWRRDLRTWISTAQRLRSMDLADLERVLDGEGRRVSLADGD